MIKVTILILFTVLIVSCRSANKKAERTVHSGNYNEAICNTIKKIAGNKEAKRNKEFIVLLKEACDKAKSKDMDAINE
jgi:hypothetical protein